MLASIVRRVKIIGAGSIGNHLAQACRRAGWDVVVVDVDQKALDRMKNEIYPQRYGAWDESIQLFVSGTEPVGGFDVIFVGTPPHVRLPLALAALAERPKVLQLEKPLATPVSAELGPFLVAADEEYSGTRIVVGYDHALSSGIQFAAELIRAEAIGAIETIDVEFREHWGGIFAAHPWLAGPADSYLGYTNRGGGASGEHSHALHLWLYLADVSNLGSVLTSHAAYQWKEDGTARYDALAAFTLKTTRGAVGRVIQDVVTKPTRKWARVQGSAGFIEWHCNGHPEGDRVVWQGPSDTQPVERIFPKKYPDDFFREILHIDDLITGKNSRSPIDLTYAVRVMHILSTSYHQNGGG